MSAGVLTTPEGIEAIRKALAEEGLDGWLLYEFRGANPIAKALLGVGKTTRRAFVLVPREGEPVALLHAIEASSWRHWPWARRTYSGWREMEDALDRLLEGRGRIAMEVSPGAAVPTLDYVPGGLTELLLRSGVELASSGNLVSRFHAVWTPQQLEDHREAAVVLADLAARAFRRAADAVLAGEPLSEGALSEWIRAQLRSAGLTDQADCIVAVGRTASDPHYAPVGAGESLTRGEVVLIDLWGARPGSVPADQTWMGFLGPELDARVRGVWEAVRDARDAALRLLRERFEAGEEVRGFEVDDVARALIEARGFGDFFVHRTGHSIDTSLHGSGPNLDNLETRDDRKLVTGVGFSVEPGVYLPRELGVRSEVNVHWGTLGPEVTPRILQDDVFLLLDA